MGRFDMKDTFLVMKLFEEITTAKIYFLREFI